MNTPTAIESAQQTLLQYGVTQFPIRMYALCEQMGIHCKLYHLKDGTDGCCGIRNKIAYIFISERDTPVADESGGGGYCTILKGTPYAFVDQRYTTQYQRFTAAHEVGHLLRGHVGSWSWVSEDGTEHHITERGMKYKQMEQEADDFAAEFLMPQCVLLALGVTEAEEIARLCNVTYPDALRTAKLIKQRVRCNSPLTDTEKALLRQFHIETRN